jgi:hypothetical protein
MSKANYDNRLNRKYGGRENLDRLISEQRIAAWVPGLSIPSLPEGLNVPGIDPSTGKTTGASGVFFPAYNRIGGQDLIVGGQIWAQVNEGAKKRKIVSWASSTKTGGVGPQIDGELPLFQNIFGEIGNTIHLCEGGEKSLILAQRLLALPENRAGVFTLGAAGGQFATGGLRKALSLLDWDKPGHPAQLILWPDAGYDENKGVRQAYYRAIADAREYAAANGLQLEIKIAWWGQISKSLNSPVPGRSRRTQDEVSDCDEIENFAAVEFQDFSSSWNSSRYAEYLKEWKPAVCPPSIRIPHQRFKGAARVQTHRGDGTETPIAAGGKRFNLDVRPTGSGKTHAIEQITGSILYFTKDPYNNPTPYIANNFVKLPAKHDGRYLHPELLDGAGNPRNQSKPNGGIEVPRNCDRVEGANNLYSAGVEDSICNGCASMQTCRTTPGWYLYDYGQAIGNSNRLKLHPQSMPTEAAKYLAWIAVFDDCSLLEPEQRKLTAAMIRVRAAHVSSNALYPEEFMRFFQDLLKASKLAQSADHRYGLSEKQLAKLREDYDKLGALPKSLFAEFERNASNPDYEGREELLDSNKNLRKGGKQGLKFADHKTVQRAREENRIEAINAQYADGAIGKMGDILFNHPDAIFKFDHNGDLTISYRNPTIMRALHSCGQVRITDATLDVEAFCALYEIDPSDVLIIEEEPEEGAHDNLVIGRVRGLGALSKLSTDRQNEIAANIAIARGKILGPGKVGFIATGLVLDLYQGEFTEAGIIVGRPHSDSRGSNSFLGCTEIYVASSLRKNLGAIITEYAVAYKMLVDPEDANANSGFVRFKNHQQMAEVVQAIGRLRHGRRPDEYLKVFFLGSIGDDVLNQAAAYYPGAALETLDACDMDGYNPTMAEAHRLAIYDQVVNLNSSGVKTTLSLIAEADGCPDPSTVGRILGQEGASTLSESKGRIVAASISGADFLPSQRLSATDPIFYERNYGPPIGLPVAAPPDPTEEEWAAQLALVDKAKAAYRANQQANERVVAELLCAGIEPPEGSPWNMSRSTSDPPVQ